MKVRMVQLLCAERHCIMAIAYVSPDGEANPDHALGLRAIFDHLAEDHVLNPWCAVCHSTHIHTEDGATKFASLEEARPVIEELRRRQLEALRMLQAARN